MALLRRRLLLAAKYYVYAAGFASLVRLVKNLINWFARRLHPKPPKLMMSETSRLAKTIREHSSVLTKPYYVTPWLFNGVVQTLSSLIPMRKRTIYTQREIIHLEKISKPPRITCCPDVVPPGVVSVDWLMPDCGFDDATPIVIIVPGLTGHSHSTYIERVSAHFAKKAVQKYRVACYNPRGRGGNHLTTPFLYSVGYTCDLRRVVRRISQQFPRAPLYAIGYSLGSNYLTKMIGEDGDACPIRAAVSVACPLDCLTTSNHLASKPMMDSGLVKFVQKMRSEYEHLLASDPKYDIEAIKEAKTMDAFDNALIAPMFDFANSSEYYRWSSAGLFLANIKIPVLIMHAANDDIVPGRAVARSTDYATHDLVVHCMLEDGAHSMDFPTGFLMWMGGESGATHSWSALAAEDFFAVVRRRAK